MTSAKPTIYVVDDDASWRTSIKRYLGARGYQVVLYESAHEFLNSVHTLQPGCILLDMRMPGLTGPELQARLTEMQQALTIVFVTAHTDVPSPVQAMKGGADDFLIKTVPLDQMVAAIDRAIQRDAEARERQASVTALNARYDTLTPREAEIFKLIALGQLNKQIAFDLGTTERTIKFHRRHIMSKLGVDSLAALVSFAERLNVQTGHSTVREQPRQRDLRQVERYGRSTASTRICNCKGRKQLAPNAIVNTCRRRCSPQQYGQSRLGRLESARA